MKQKIQTNEKNLLYSKELNNFICRKVLSSILSRIMKCKENKIKLKN